ncbi:MAG: hypothetical protein KAR21_22470 [Spirochaetales bacterium]|nr:hypothetical protein [Spirochaetales bacterium]
MILGIPDFSVGLAYLLMILLTLVSAVYGFVNWNKGGDLTDEELETERKWMKEEIALEEEVDGGVS